GRPARPCSEAPSARNASDAPGRSPKRQGRQAREAGTRANDDTGCAWKDHPSTAKFCRFNHKPSIGGSCIGGRAAMLAASTVRKLRDRGTRRVIKKHREKQGRKQVRRLRC